MEFRTRFKELCNRIINSPLLIFTIFFICNILIYFFQKAMSVNLDVYHKFSNAFLDFFEKLYTLITNGEQISVVYGFINTIAVLVTIADIIYWFKKFNLYKSNINKVSKFNYIITIFCSLITVGILINVTGTIEVIYSICGTIIHIISKLLLNNIETIPSGCFGINIMFRLLIINIILYLIIKAKYIYKYFFVDKIKIENDKVVKTIYSDKEGISRVIRFFYNEEQNKLNIKNIATILSIFSALGIISIGLGDRLMDGQLLEKCWKILKIVLQVSTINDTPFAQPVPAATLINIVFRILSVHIYTLCAVFLIYVLCIIILAINKNKNILYHVSIAGLIIAWIGILVLFIYLVSYNAEAFQNSKMTVFGAIGGCIVIAIFVGLTIWAFWKIKKSKKSPLSFKHLKDKFNSLFENINEVIKNLVDPLLKELDVNDKKEHKGLYAGANFCAIASLLTTFVGLIIFFKDTILTANLLMSISSIIICFCITTGVQYSMLKIGLEVGRYIGTIFERSKYIYKKKVDSGDNLLSKAKNFLVFHMKCGIERGRRIIIVIVLLIVYFIPMTISSLFSFSSLFSAASLFGHYRDIVNDDVWNYSVTQSKAVMDEIVNKYNKSNNNIERAVDNVLDKYTKYYNVLSAWDQVNSNDAVDGHVIEFKEKTKGMQNYRNTINLILLEDRYDNYNATLKEQNVYFNDSLIYTVRGHEITYPFQINLIQLESENDSFKKIGPIDERNINNIGKYQVIDILINQYISLMKETEFTYNSAIGINPARSQKISDIAQNMGFEEDEDNILNVYLNNIDNARRIYESYSRIRNDIDSDPKSTITKENFISVNQLPAAVIKHSMYDIDNKASKKSEDKTEKQESVETNFETRISRITNMLSYLPEIADEDENEDMTVSNTIKKINEYSNYANTRNISLAFGLDVVYRGNDCNLPQIRIAKILLNIRSKIDNNDKEVNKFLNPYNNEIKTIYDQSVTATFLFIIAFLIDLMPIILGLFMIALDSIKKIKIRFIIKRN